MSWWERGAARVVLALLWLVHWLPLAVQAALGRGVGAMLHALARRRRRIAVRNLELCFPDWPAARRAALVREHFACLGRSMVERGLLWYAPGERLKRLIHVEGEIDFAEKHDGPVMWLVPHFMGLDVAGMASQLYQRRLVASIYQRQSNPVFDERMRAGRLRFGNAQIFSRHETALPLVRSIKRGAVFLNLPDMDFGAKDAAFVPFFGVPAATLLAPARMAASMGLAVQPVIAEMLPGGQGYRVRFLPPWRDFPGPDDEVAATRRINAFIESQIEHMPAQYLWVHRRFKSRPAGEAKLY